MSAAKSTPGPNPMHVQVRGREYAVYFHHATGEPHCVETTVRMQGVPIAGRRLSMNGPTALAAIAKATGSSALAKAGSDGTPSSPSAKAGSAS